MSLLNDALRKKKDKRHIEERRPALIARPSNRNNSIKKWGLPVGLCCLVVLGAIMGRWYWRQSVDATPLPLSNMTPMDNPVNDPRAQPATLPADTVPPTATVVTIPQTMQHETESAPPDSALSTAISGQQTPPVIPAVKPPKRKPVPSKAIPGGTALRLEKKSSPALPTVAVKNYSTVKPQRESIVRLYRKAKSYHRQNRLGKAIDMYREVLKIDPDHFDALFNLSSAYLQTGIVNKAYRIAADLNLRSPDNHQVTLNLAIAQIGIGRPAEAIRLLESVGTQKNVPQFEVYFHKGVAHRHLGHLEEAIAWYRQAEQLKPTDASLLFNLAMAFDQLLQYAQAVHYYKEYLQAYKNSTSSTHLPMDKIQQRIRSLQVALSQQSYEKEQER